MLRKAKRLLTGGIVAGHDHDIRYGLHVLKRPAVTVDLRGWNETRTYDDPADLRRLANELNEAAAWLGHEISEAKQ